VAAITGIAERRVAAREIVMVLAGFVLMAVNPAMRTAELGLPVAAVGIGLFIARRLSPPLASAWHIPAWLLTVGLAMVVWLLGPWFVSQL
jgi:hypothetical protein